MVPIFWPTMYVDLAHEYIHVSYAVLVGISPGLLLGVQFQTKMNWLYFEVKRSKVKVTVRPNVVKKALREILKVVHSNVTVTDNLSDEGMLVNGSKSLHPLTRAGKNLGF